MRAFTHTAFRRATVYADRLPAASVRSVTATPTITLLRNAAGKRSTDFGR